MLTLVQETKEGTVRAIRAELRDMFVYRSMYNSSASGLKAPDRGLGQQFIDRRRVRKDKERAQMRVLIWMIRGLEAQLPGTDQERIHCFLTNLKKVDSDSARIRDLYLDHIVPLNVAVPAATYLPGLVLEWYNYVNRGYIEISSDFYGEVEWSYVCSDGSASKEGVLIPGEPLPPELVELLRAFSYD